MVFVFFAENALDIKWISKEVGSKEWTFLKNCAFHSVEKYNNINTK